jgi:putative DNA primase/helicase
MEVRHVDGRKVVQSVGGLSWRKDATTDPERIRRWWARWPDAVPAIDCERSGIVVIDCDVKDGIDGIAAWRELAAIAPMDRPVWVQTPSGGRHYVYRALTDAPVKTTTGELATGVDTRAVGGMIFGWGTLPAVGSLDPVPDVVRERVPHGAVLVRESAMEPARIVDDPFATLARTFSDETARTFYMPALTALAAALSGTINDRLNIAAKTLYHFVPGLLDREAADALLTEALGWTVYDGRTWTARVTMDSAWQASRRDWLAEPEPVGAVVEHEPESVGAVVEHPEAPADEKDGAGFFGDAILVEALHRQELAGRWVWTKAVGWYRWTGTVWSETSDQAATEVVRRWVTAQFRRAARKAEPTEKDLALLKEWRKCLSRSRIEAVLGLARGLCEVPLERFDADPLLLNTPAGVLDLTTGALTAHHPKYAMTRITNAGPGDIGRADWEKFLDHVLPDESVRSYVQRLLGHALLGEVREHLLPIWHGGGRNGKGTLRDAVLGAVGLGASGYGLEVDPALIMKKGSDRHLTFMMELRGRRVVFTSETQRDQHLDEPVAKRLVGGDPLQANRMRRDPVTFIPSHTLIMMTNYLPIISGDDGAMARRVKVVPWEVEIPEGEEDVRLPATLRAAAPAVMAWLIVGLRDYTESGLTAPEPVRTHTSEYVRDSDPLARFLSERTVAAVGIKTPARKLYVEYHQWMADLGHRRPASEKAFSDQLRSMGFDRMKTMGGMVWLDLQLKIDGTCACPNGNHGVHADDCF